MGTHKSRLLGRDARTGEFKSVEDARRDPDHNVVERVPLPGHGVSKPPKKK